MDATKLLEPMPGFATTLGGTHHPFVDDDPAQQVGIVDRKYVGQSGRSISRRGFQPLPGADQALAPMRRAG